MIVDSNSKHCSIFLTSTNTKENANLIAQKLVTSKVAACVSIVNQVESVYSWDGELCQEHELLLVIKTYSDQSEILKEIIKKHHPYKVAELIEIKAELSLDDYGNWFKKSLEK